MDVSVGTFNLNNLFGRWNLYVDAPAPPPTGAPAPSVEGAATTPAASTPERDWLEEAPVLEGTTRASQRGLPDVKIVIEGNLTAEGIKWRTNPADGRVVRRSRRRPRP
jgi:hypothetical protein